jgi:hypothetical protein
MSIKEFTIKDCSNNDNGNKKDNFKSGRILLNQTFTDPKQQAKQSKTPSKKLVRRLSLGKEKCEQKIIDDDTQN